MNTQLLGALAMLPPAASTMATASALSSGVNFRRSPWLLIRTPFPGLAAQIQVSVKAGQHQVNGVHAVLGWPDIVVSHRETDRLAATLAHYWAGPLDMSSPLGRFLQTGAISEATVDALYEDLVALEQAAGSDPSPRRGGEWTSQAVVRALLEYAAVHRPRGPVPDWKALRDDRTAASVFRQLPSERP